ncbi:diguanylate cyclase [Methanobacterium sp. YSL]|nr:diguanylate cyclase [Methanobacterium sp. YSL]
MNEFLLLCLVVVGFMSFIPVVNLFKSSREERYRCLKLLMLTTFTWSVLIFIERISSVPSIIYHAHLLGYPMKFMVMVFSLCTIYDYVEEKLPKIVLSILMILGIAEVGFALTNNSTQWFVQLTLAEMSTFSDLYFANKGPLYLYHLVFTYAVMIFAMIALFYYVIKKKDTIKSYGAVTRTITMAVIIVLVLNLLDLLFIDTDIDLTYISLAFGTFILYRVTYTNDMIFNLLTSGRGKILSNMRELYILTDEDKRVVEFSEMLTNKYGIKPSDYVGKKLDDLYTGLKDQIVFYRNYEIDVDVTQNKDHYHVRERKFYIQKNHYGYMILLYDETQVFKLLRELNQLSNFDTMTGLNNRNYIENKLKKYNHKSNLGIISLDLNGLKVNNDYLGHERGDYLLKSVSSKIKQVMSQINPKEIARIGGDEFLIILPNTTQEMLVTLKAQIVAICQNDDVLENISVSIGTAFDKTGTILIYDLIKIADADMYQMKSETSSIYTQLIIEYVQKKSQFMR